MDLLISFFFQTKYEYYYFLFFWYCQFCTMMPELWFDMLSYYKEGNIMIFEIYLLDC